MREFAKCLIFVHSFNFHSNLMRLFPLLSPFLSFIILDKETEVQDDELFVHMTLLDSGGARV